MRFSMCPELLAADGLKLVQKYEAARARTGYLRPIQTLRPIEVCAILGGRANIASLDALGLAQVVAPKPNQNKLIGF